MELQLGQGSWGDYSWSVIVEFEGRDRFLSAALRGSDGRRRRSGMGGPITWPGHPLNVYAGRADGFPITLLAQSDRASGLTLSIDGSDVRPLWTHVRDGVSYLFHLAPDSRSMSTVEVIGRTEAGEVRESAHIPQ